MSDIYGYRKDTNDIDRFIPDPVTEPIARLSGVSKKKQQTALNAVKQKQAKVEKRLAQIGELK